MIVRLEDDTTGKPIVKIFDIGDIITIQLHDENGNTIEKSGKVVEILID